MSVFAHDWEFTTKENLPFDAWCCNTWNAPMPHVPARGIRSGPDRYIVGTHTMLLGAFAVAQKQISIQSHSKIGRAHVRNSVTNATIESSPTHNKNQTIHNT